MNEKISFPFFSNKVKDPKPIGNISLEQFIRAHIKPKGNIRAIFEVIASANDKYKAFLKQNYLYYFTPCVQVANGRKYTDIINWTGLLVLDFDKIDDAEKQKQKFFDITPWCITAYLSPSAKGFKALIKIPVCSSVEEFKRRHYALEQVIEKFPGYDSTSKNCVLPLFQSYDPNLLYREDVEVFKHSLEPPNAFKPSDVKPIVVDSTDKDRQSVHRIVSHSINKITSDGHPQVRGASIMLGGYVASGYIDLIEAEQLMENLIRSNSYLSKGTKGYIETSKWAIKQGTNNQLFLE